MKILCGLVVVLLVVCLALPARARECTRAFHLRENDKAPCEGDLVPVFELLRLLEAEDALDRANAEILLWRERLAAAEAAAKDEIQAAAERLEVERKARRACEDEKAPPVVVMSWYESPVFWGVAGTLLGVGGTILVVKAVR
jgi:hypothetical protein